MAGLLKRESKAVEPMDPFARFDRLFDDWMTMLPFRRPELSGMQEALIRVDEYREEGTLVVRAEMPGIDPDKDVEITISEGMLHIEAHRREQHERKEEGYVRREMSYGTFTRTLPLPQGASETDVTASYKDGILEIRVPMPEVQEPARTPIPISRA